MKKTYKIPLVVAQNVAVGYNRINAAKEFFRAAYSDPGCPGVFNTVLTNINASLTLLQNRIDKGIPITNKERFEQQVVNADSLGLDEINRTYFLLSPEKQAILESVASELSIGAIDIANEHPFEQDIETHLNYGNETVL